MKNVTAIALGLTLAASMTSAFSQEPVKKERKHPEQAEAQRKIHKDMLTKYDANKDGRLDEEERKKMTEEVKTKYRDSRPHTPKKQVKHEKTEKKDGRVNTNAAPSSAAPAGSKTTSTTTK